MGSAVLREISLCIDFLAFFFHIYWCETYYIPSSFIHLSACFFFNWFKTNLEGLFLGAWEFGIFNFIPKYHFPFTYARSKYQWFYCFSPQRFDPFFTYFLLPKLLWFGENIRCHWNWRYFMKVKLNLEWRISSSSQTCLFFTALM